MAAYYNEIDPFAAMWLRNLIARGLIAPGDVDERSIEDVSPDDLRPYTQCHFFAGIGVWSHALRGAGWDDDRAVWTGSCPCQPFSSSGKRDGFADERHLWPAWFHLIRECRPPVVFGEQVASKDGLSWIDLVQSDLEGEGYASGGFDLCAAGFGAPHIRQRLYFAAVDGMGNAFRSGLEGYSRHGDDQGGRAVPAGSTTETSSLNVLAAASRKRGDGMESPSRSSRWYCPQDCGPTNGHWRDAEWVYCRDEKFRPVEPGVSPLAYGAPSRVGRLRAYGNAIVAPQAREFIYAAMQVIHV